ncbi:hypothetical protein IWX90DRAFT_244682 [Phyllosticta citrichinensis]|uniref:Uncharacterized protein n=1 Tax=Phyllosticta citrichinensis TaxID=1130410 RepID=A0ABR1XQT0_9PEZI
MSYQHPPPHYQRPRGMSVPTTGPHAANLPPPPPGPPPSRRRSSNQTIYPPPWSNHPAPAHTQYPGYHHPQTHAPLPGPPPGPPPQHHPGHHHSHSHSAHHHSRGYSVPSMPPGPPPSTQQHGMRPRRQSVQSGPPPTTAAPPHQAFPQSILKTSPQSTKRVHFAESVEARKKENSERSRSADSKGDKRRSSNLGDFHVMMIDALDKFENMDVPTEQELARRLYSLASTHDESRMRNAIDELSRIGAYKTGTALLQLLIEEFRSACEGEIADADKRK